MDTSKATATPPENYEWVTTYKDLLVGAAEKHAHHWRTEAAYEGELCQCVVLVRREDFSLLSHRHEFRFKTLLDALDPNIDELHRHRSELTEIKDPHAWALLRWADAFEKRYMRAVVRATKQEQLPHWAAYVNHVTGEVAYGSLSEQALIELLQMLASAPPYFSFLKQYLITRAPEPRGTLEAYLFPREGLVHYHDAQSIDAP